VQATVYHYCAAMRSSRGNGTSTRSGDRRRSSSMGQAEFLAQPRMYDNMLYDLHGGWSCSLLVEHTGDTACPVKHPKAA